MIGEPSGNIGSSGGEGGHRYDNRWKGNLASLKRTCLEVYTRFVWGPKQIYPLEWVGYPMKMHSLVLGSSLWEL